MPDHFWQRQMSLWFLLGLVCWLMFATSIAQYQAQNEGGAMHSVYPLLFLGAFAGIPTLFFAKHFFEALLATAIGLALGVSFLAVHLWLAHSEGSGLLSVFVKAWFVSSAMIHTIAPIVLLYAIAGSLVRYAHVRTAARSLHAQNA